MKFADAVVFPLRTSGLGWRRGLGRLALMLAGVCLVGLSGCRSARAAYQPGRLAKECASGEGAAVCAVVMAAEKGVWDSDPDEVMPTYRSDALRVSATGNMARGDAEIRSMLHRLFLRPEAAGIPAAPVEIRSVQFVSPGVAVVYSYVEKGGESVDVGQPVFPMAKTHELRVLNRGSDGKWLVVSDIVSTEDPG